MKTYQMPPALLSPRQVMRRGQENWHQRRIRSYARRKKMTLAKAKTYLLNLPSFEEAFAEVDSVVDPKYHSSQRPKF